jgi:hypothetical protein
MNMASRLATTLGGLRLPNPVLCGFGGPVMTKAGRAADARQGYGNQVENRDVGRGSCRRSQRSA